MVAAPARSASSLSETVPLDAKERNTAKRQIDRLILRRDVEMLAAQLQNPNTTGALIGQVLNGLVRINSPQAWESIEEMLARDSGFAIDELIATLKAMGSPTAINALGRALGNPNIFVRGASIRALTQLADPRVLAHLLRASRDPERSLARLSGRTLLRRVTHNPALLAELRGVTSDGILDLMDEKSVAPLMSSVYPDDLRALSARRLGEFESDESAQTLARLVTSKSSAISDACWKALENRVGIPREILQPLIQHCNPSVAARAVPLFVRHVGTDGANSLRLMVNSEHAELRQAALAGLPQTLGTAAIPILVESLNDPSNRCVEAALSALCSESESTFELTQVVEKHDGVIRRTALTTLANRGVATDSLIPHYIEFLSEGAQCTDLSQRHYLDSLARVAAALGKAGDQEALVALADLSRSVIRRIRRAAVEGLMAFPAVARADTLFNLTDTHDPDVLKNVAFGLTECHDTRSTVPLIRTFMECRGRVRKRAGDLLQKHPNLTNVDFLIRCLKEPFASVRQWGANQLQDIHDDRSIDPLLDASHDDDVEVQLAVFEALGPFGAEHDRVRERLLQAIGYGDISVRQAACEALGNARCQEAVPDLIRALHNFFLRPRATDALRRIGARKGYLAIRRLERREKLFSKKPKDAQTR